MNHQTMTMMRRTRVGLTFALLAGTLGAGHAALAMSCLDNNSHQCWATLSGPNYSQVVVGATFDGAGIACAVTSPQTTNWGGVLHCYGPVGSSGAIVLGRGGEEADPNGPFRGTDPTQRMVSLAMRNFSTVTTNRVTIYALRSDGQVFSATTSWPKAASDDPRIFFVADSVAAPSGLKSIAYLKFTGLIGATSSNQLYKRTDSGWVLMSADSVVLLASSHAYGVLDLLGSDGFSTTIGSPSGGPVPPPLPMALASAPSDPNKSFNSGLGRTTPLTSDQLGAYALLPGNCPVATLTPCIVRSDRSATWSAWHNVQTGDISEVAPYTMPWSIQDGRVFRGVQGEIWVIAGPAQLKFWAP